MPASSMTVWTSSVPFPAFAVTTQTDQCAAGVPVVLPHARLAEKIRAARVNKERSLQLQEKAQLAAQEAEYNKVYDTVSGHASTMAHQRQRRHAFGCSATPQLPAVACSSGCYKCGQGECRALKNRA